MHKILKVTPNDDYSLLIEFEQGDKILFNMREHIKSIPFSSLEDLSRFKNIQVEERAICWPDPMPGQKSIIPLRLTVDNILFAIRENYSIT
jgi:hypothetical protein